MRYEGDNISMADNWCYVNSRSVGLFSIAKCKSTMVNLPQLYNNGTPYPQKLTKCHHNVYYVTNCHTMTCFSKTYNRMLGKKTLPYHKRKTPYIYLPLDEQTFDVMESACRNSSMSRSDLFKLCLNRYARDIASKL
jgi:hypothetical protein